MGAGFSSDAPTPKKFNVCVEYSPRRFFAGLALAAHADLRFRQQQIVAVQSQDFLGAESLQQHQSYDGQVTRSAETGPESRHLIHRQWGYGAFWSLHPQSAQG